MANRVPTDKALEVARRRKQAIELRLAGLQWADIAEQLGYTGKASAQKDVKRAIAGVTADAAQDYVNEEVARLDRMLAGLWPQARAGHLGAIDRVVKIMQERRVYLPLTASADIPLSADGSIVLRFATPLPSAGSPHTVVDLPPTED